MSTQQTEGLNGRLQWLDVLKCVAMYIVVIGHASNATDVDSYRYYIYSFHMPLFFIISGMAFYLQLQKKEWTFGEMLANKAKTLVWPYITLNLLALPIWYCNFRILSYRDQPISSLFLAILYSNQHLFSSATNATWFILTLFLTLIIFFLLFKWAKGSEYIIVIGASISGLAGYASSFHQDIHLPWHLDTVPMALALVMIGYVALCHIDWIQKQLQPTHIKVILFMVCLFAGIFLARFNVKITMHGNSYGSLIMFLGAVMSFSICCLIIALILPPLRVFTFVGRNTIIMLALHAPCFRFCEVFSETTATFKENHPIFLGTIVFFIMIPICYVFERFLPFLLGRKSKKNRRLRWI